MNQRTQQRTQRRNNGPLRAPMLVMRGIVNDQLETRERMAVEAFALGFASTEHFDTLTDMQGVLLLAGSTDKRRHWAMHYARNEIGNVLISIKERHTRTGKLGCNAEELKTLRGFVSKYRDFWLHQPTELYEAAVQALQAHYDKQRHANQTDKPLTEIS